MRLSVGDLRKIYPLGLWVILIYLQRITVFGQLSPEYTDTRQFPSNTGIQVEQIEDYAAGPDQSAENYDESLGQHTLNAEIAPNGRSLETHQVGDDNEKRVISDRFQSEDKFEQNNFKAFPQLKNLSGNQQYKQYKVPIRYTVRKRPLQRRGMYNNLYYQPYGFVPSGNTLFRGLGDQRNSNEIIKKLMGAGRNNVGLGNTNQLKNAFLTKVTSYNITKLKGEKNNESFLFEKKDNSSSDISYLDSNNRTTNYSDIHTSSLKTFLQPGKQVYENISHQEAPSRLFNNNKIKKVEEDEQNNQRKPNSKINILTNKVLYESNNVRDDKLPKDIMSQKNGETTDLYSHETGANNEIADQNNAKSQNEGKNFIADDFVGGQYVLRNDKQNIPSLGSTQPYEYKGRSDSMSGQSISDPEVKYDFVGGQFVDLLGRSSSEFRTAPTSLITTDNTISDFVEGQYLRNSSEEELTSTFLQNKENLMETVGDQHMNKPKSNNEELNEKDDYENNLALNEQITTIVTEKTDFSKQSTDKPEVMTNFDDGLATESNFYTSDPKESIDFDKTLYKDKMLNKDNYLSESLYPDKLKALNFNDKEYTTQYGYSKLLTSPGLGEVFPTTTYQTKKKEDKIESKILSDKKQSSPGKIDTPMASENYEGLYAPISILGDSQTKTDIKSEESIHKDKNNVSTIHVDKENNKYATYIKKNKIAGPILIPYLRSRIPSRGMSSDHKILTRPINVISAGNKMYIPQFHPRTNERGRPFVMGTNNPDNVVFQANDGNTEVIVSVSTSPPHDTLQNNLPISNTKSNEESQTIVNSEHEGFTKNNELDISKTKMPNSNTKNIPPNSEYEEYEEDDGILGNSNSNKSYSILEMDPNTSHYFTELVDNYFKTQFTTEPNDIKDRVNVPFEDDRGVSSASTSSDVTMDSIVGESSDILPNHLISQSPTSLSLLNIDGKTYDESNIPSQNLSDPTNMSDDVELHVGNPLSTIVNNNGSPVTDINSNFHGSDNIKFSEKEPEKNSQTKKGHLAELCIPLTNEKYVSLLDLLSGPFYFDRNGRKVAISVRGDHKKNCNLRSKQCKLFIDLKNISNSLNPDNSLELNKEDGNFFQQSKHEKRHITKDLTLNQQEAPSNPKEISSDSYKTDQVDQSNEEKSSLDIPLSYNLRRSFLDPNLKNAFDTGSQTFSTIYKEDKKRTQYLKHSSDVIPTRFNSRTTLYSNENSHDLHNYDSESMQHGPYIHKRRPARMIDSGRSSEGEKCGCGENQILKSPSPLPNYKEFVAKRFDILKNIVHTVGDWAAN